MKAFWIPNLFLGIERLIDQSGQGNFNFNFYYSDWLIKCFILKSISEYSLKRDYCQLVMAQYIFHILPYNSKLNF